MIGALLLGILGRAVHFVFSALEEPNLWTTRVPMGIAAGILVFYIGSYYFGAIAELDRKDSTIARLLSFMVAIVSTGGAYWAFSWEPIWVLVVGVSACIVAIKNLHLYKILEEHNPQEASAIRGWPLWSLVYAAAGLGLGLLVFLILNLDASSFISSEEALTIPAIVSITLSVSTLKGVVNWLCVILITPFAIRALYLIDQMVT